MLSSRINFWGNIKTSMGRGKSVELMQYVGAKPKIP